MSHYGIIGYPLSHSFSPGYFREQFRLRGIDATYEAFPIETISALPALLEQNPALRGLNVTIPYKQSVMAYLHELDDTARAVGAVNCIRISEGRLKGFNTDCVGFATTLQPLLGDMPRQALVLGTGGAAKAVVYALAQLGIPYQLVSRSGGDLQYAALTPELIAGHTLIINTTPLGMYPAVDTYPDLPYGALGPQHILYDLVYNPEATLFLGKGRQQGATVKNGYDMLIAQADAGWAIWNEPL
ncbi:shikimate dehydrogenase family protein [Taibaiella chishuiensis]|uniref:Shikimate dehydrogenase n=1 Tax=Taibaiella chishuiensis TaxID=1434707 RepID=A0A2P8DBT4_9BACT|nr:shikimate dehydrogenase [Taibaiella chishuiensis]PSK94693.1 shikimate dehydrogenase [Taibaiella chishuiensis]